MTASAPPRPGLSPAAIEASTQRAERAAVHFVENLSYLLGWPGTADDIASHLGIRDSAGVEKRFERMGITETPLAERFRRRKPGYCSECRLTRYAHRQTCSEFIPDRSCDERNRNGRARRMVSA